MRIEVEDLGKSVWLGEERLDILAGVSFTVNSGETVAVLGSSGSGKSTLLGLLAGLDTPSTGSVRVDGTDLFGLDEDGRAALRGRGMGFVFQAFQLLPDLSALDNVMLPLELAGAADARERARAQLARVGLARRERHRPGQLSGGEQQRVALARAFAVAPRLLLADEPTGNLDPHTGAQIIDLMLDLNREQGATLIVVSHDPALAARCGRQLRLEGGRLA
ncbi:ABC transporter ATP-binding protein [Parasulfuritortus cantonensis]|uniref:ABC transporter ATP-binding protein n=1 Tax=Parasulfuritortus cantonensis TaxID=2528202 RepID=A0A4V2NVG7_9PROT|nr:ABC transporter ATP-binding protein [Parasulfuritortus cantonensis]TCJ13426.1 ABC transporter ATP-binding protein [Parasulfuritortus cantonensis]